MFKGLKEGNTVISNQDVAEIKALAAYVDGLSGFFAVFPHNENMEYERKVSSLTLCGERLRDITNGLQKEGTEKTDEADVSL